MKIRTSEYFMISLRVFFEANINSQQYRKNYQFIELTISENKVDDHI